MALFSYSTVIDYAAELSLPRVVCFPGANVETSECNCWDQFCAGNSCMTSFMLKSPAGSGWSYVDIHVIHRWSSARRELDGDSSRTPYLIRRPPVQKAHEQFILKIQSINSMMSLPLIMVSTI
ncbi:UNVERIFIED_CONTAM: hypothetical protein Sindi_0986800, partial [Sesamum indicum]